MWPGVHHCWAGCLWLASCCVWLFLSSIAPCPLFPHLPCSTLLTCMLCTLPWRPAWQPPQPLSWQQAAAARCRQRWSCSAESRGLTAALHCYRTCSACWQRGSRSRLRPAAAAAAGQRLPVEQQRWRCRRPRNMRRPMRLTLPAWRGCALRQRGQQSWKRCAPVPLCGMHVLAVGRQMCPSAIPSPALPSQGPRESLSLPPPSAVPAGGAAPAGPRIHPAPHAPDQRRAHRGGGSPAA